MSTRIDPRLRQRRIAVRRAEGRRRLRLLLGGIAVAVVVAGAYALTQSSWLDLDRVEVAGAIGSEIEEVAAATGLELGTPLVDVDVDAARDAVTQLPWVLRAEVSRSWPGTVHVDVVRRVPLAVLPTGDGGGVTIDEDGVAIAPTASTNADLPVIAVTAAGELGDVQEFALPAIAVVQSVPADLAPWIETFDIAYRGGEDGELVLDLVGSAIAELGAGPDIDAKLDALRTVLGRVDLTCIELIDVRVAELPLVQRDARCEATVTGS